ncbi:T-cell antigen CD7 [Molossus nigricans]
MAPRLPLLPLLLALAPGLLPAALATTEVWQFPSYAVTPDGGSINITCSTRGPLLGLYLIKSIWQNTTNVIYHGVGATPTVDRRFRGRIVFSGPTHNLTVTMHRLQQADSGAYICEAITMNQKVWGSGTLVVVTDTVFYVSSTCQETSLVHTSFPVVLAVGLLVVLGLGVVCVLRWTQIRKLCWARKESSVCVVYEDMSCSRRDTVSTPNHYQL